MLFQQSVRPRLAAALLVAACLAPAAAFPYPKDDEHNFARASLIPRQCGNPCGWQNRVCCNPGEQCQTVNYMATCAPGGALVPAFTTTWTQTQTLTSTAYSQLVAPTAPPSNEPCKPPEGSGQKQCGTLCCAAWQYCAQSLPLPSCMANAGVGSTVYTVGGVATTQFSAAYRVTAGTTTFVTTGVPSAVTTVPTTTPTTFIAGGATSGGTGGSGLSPGAIAGIVVGVLAGIALLGLICFCCIVRGLWNLCFGGKKKDSHRGSRTEITEEYYSKHGSPPPRKEHRGWFGFGGAKRPSSVESRKKKKSDGAGWLGLAAAAGTLALLLGLRKEKKKPSSRRGGRSRYSGSGGYSDYTHSSWSNSDRPSKLHPEIPPPS